MSTTILDIEKKKTLVPQLRFQEFEGHWKIEKLQSRISTIDSGWSPQCEEFPSTENEWGVLKTTSVVWEGFNESANKKLPEKLDPRPELQVSINDILITRAGPSSRVGVTVHVNKVRSKLMLSDKLIRLRSNENCSSLFLSISLSNSSTQKQLVSKSSGLAESQTNISQKILLNTKLAFPSLPEQQKIASFLSSVDEKIQQLTRKKELLEQYKKGVMQQLFSGKLRFKDENGEDYADWGEKKLGDLVKIKSGNSPSDYLFIKDGIYPFIKVEELNNCSKFQKNSRFYSNDIKNLIEAKSVIFPKRGAAILNNKVRINDCSILMDSNMMALIPLRKELDVEFLYFKIMMAELFKIADTSSIPQINNKHIEPYIISTPCLEEQQKIADFLASIDRKIDGINQQLAQTQTFKKGLLQQMFV